MLAIVVGIGGQYVRPDAISAVLAGFGRLPLPRAGSRASPSALMLINTLGPEGVAPFIYFRF